MASVLELEDRDLEDADDWVGRIIDGRYRVLAQVGTGGMGAVYRVEHVRMGKVAAMKVLHSDLARHPSAVKRFRREVEVVSRLDHPHIVQTFDCGNADGQLYLIMEYVRGEDLAAIVWRDGPLPVPRALALAIQVCSALEEAHDRGVIHCDLKPDNIVCAHRRGIVHAKVLDFGLARLRENADTGDGTQTVLLGGTPSYMSPEQVRFETVDARSDLYSLGATIYRLVTGEAAFEASTPIGVMQRHLTDDLVPPSLRAPALRLPEAVDSVVARAMARCPEDRYASAAQMRDDLQAAFDQVTGVSAGWRRSSSSSESSSEDALARLEREDLDAFERQVRRRRIVGTFVATPVLLTTLALAGWAGPSLLPNAPTVEREPNDSAALAALLPRHQPVRGRIGAGWEGQPDFDYFRIPAGPGARAVTAHITGVPDVDLVLELFDERGKLLARANAAGAGGAEALGPVAIGAGEAFVRARPLWTAGAPAAGVETAAYDLTVDWGAPRADWELEPDDTPAQALTVEAPRMVSGTLASDEDQDWFRVRVPAGRRLEARVDGIDGVDLVLRVGPQEVRVDRRGAGEHESVTGVAGADGCVLVGVARLPGPPSDEPYHLDLRLK